MNSMLKVYLFRRTMRGGGNGNGSKMEPIARWLGRRLVWMSGKSYDAILLKVNEKTVTTADMGEKPEEVLSAVDMESLAIHDHANLDIDRYRALI
jgi:hypothetical protein